MREKKKKKINQAPANLKKQTQTNPTAKPESWKEQFLSSLHLHAAVLLTT